MTGLDQKQLHYHLREANPSQSVINSVHTKDIWTGHKQRRTFVITHKCEVFFE